jgi:DnaK suppressor protein
MKKIRARLERERDAAIRRLRELGVTEVEPPRLAEIGETVDVADHAQANEQQEMGLVTRERLAERINRLTAALERVDNGTYGICIECGRPIEKARLEAIPEVERCRECQEKQERLGRSAA